MCESWRNSFFGCCFLPFFLVALLLHLCCTSDPSCCLSLLLEIENFRSSLAAKHKGSFISTYVLPSANQRCSYGLQGVEEVGWDMVPKGSAELMFLGCRRKLGSIFLLQWFRSPCLSSEADVLCVSVWGFGLCQEQLGRWFQGTFWWAHFWRQIPLQSVTHSSLLSHLSITR